MASGTGSGLWGQYMRDVGWDKVPRRSILDSSKLRHPAHGGRRFLCPTPRCLVYLSICCLGTYEQPWSPRPKSYALAPMDSWQHKPGESRQT